MKSQIKKAAAVTLAMAMCVPCTALAADERTTISTGSSGQFDTSFGVYSPAITVSVPLSANIEVNPMADTSAAAKTVKNYTVASNSIDIWNGSVDKDANSGKGEAIPVNVTAQAVISAKGDDVVTVYDTTFTGDVKSAKKKIHLELAQAQTGASVKVKDGETAAYTADGKLDLTKYTLDDQADYTTPAQKVPITANGSLLSVDIGQPTSGNTDTTDFSNAGDVKPTVGSFAVIGSANSNADWQAEDIQVDIIYNIKASKAVGLTAPTLTAVTGSTGSDVVITVTNVGEATLAGVGLHNDEDYGDFVWAEDAYTIDDTTAGTIKITIPKGEETIAFLKESHDGEAQDLVIALSDGRVAVSTLTVN